MPRNLITLPDGSILDRTEGEEDTTERPVPPHRLPPESPNYRPLDPRKTSIERAPARPKSSYS